MEPFQLAEDAILDMDAIWLYLLEREGLETAHRLAEMPGSGHRRADLTSRPVLFYRIFSYLIVYQPGSEPLEILGVLHGKRNVARILRQRL